MTCTERLKLIREKARELVIVGRMTDRDCYTVGTLSLRALYEAIFDEVRK
jgi:hypothetical protein